MSQEMIIGGDLVARTLADAGVRKVFTLHGGHLDAIYQGCVRQGIELIDTRHEAPAGHAAEAFARMTGDLAVCITTSGAGFSNTVPAFVNAYLDCDPVLFIVGAPPLREAYTRELQGGFDQIAMANPVMKWAYRVTNGERIPDILAEAIRVARNGRPGPVLIEVPIDILHIPVPLAHATQPIGVHNHPSPAPAPNDTAALIEALQQAERPALVAGAGAMYSGCADELQAFAEQSGIPVFANMNALGIMDPDHPLMGGMVSGMAALGPMGMAPPDLVVLLGARLGFGMGGRSGAVIPRDARLAQIDVDGAALGRLQEVDIPIVADCREALLALAEAGREVEWPDRAAWAQQATGAGDLVRAYNAEQHPHYGESGRIHPYHAARVLFESLPANTNFCSDGGDTQNWVFNNARIAKGSRLVSGGSLGHLGGGTGYGIGIHAADPDSPTVLITGDGAIGFHLQEFHTMVRHNMPVITVVFCNGTWGTSMNGQKALYGEEGVIISDIGDVPYHEIARSFGGHGEQVERLEDIAPAIERALASGVASCINLLVDGDAITESIAALTMSDNPEAEIPIPYYEAVPIVK